MLMPMTTSMACTAMSSWVRTTKVILGRMAMCMIRHLSPLLHVMTLVATVIIAMHGADDYSTVGGYDGGTGGGYDWDGYNGGCDDGGGDGTGDYGGDY